MGFSTWLVILFVTAVLYEGAYTLYQFLNSRREKQNMKAYREQFYAELIEINRNRKPKQETEQPEGVPINGAGGCCKHDK